MANATPLSRKGTSPTGGLPRGRKWSRGAGSKARAIASVLAVAQEFLEARAKLRAIFGLAVPDDQNLPSKFLERCNMLSVARDVAFEFRRPVAGIGFGLPRIEAACLGVQVPETAVHENDFSAGTEHEIRFAGQVLAMQAVTMPKSCNEAADG